MNNHTYHDPNPSTPNSTLSASHSPHLTRLRISNTEDQIRGLEDELMAARESIRCKNDEIAALHTTVETLRHRIEALQIRIHKQEVTIRNQSKTIQDPRSQRTRRVAGDLPAQTPIPQPPGLPPVQSSQPYHMSFQNYPGFPQNPALFAAQQSLRGFPDVHNQLLHQPQLLQPMPQQIALATPMYSQTTGRSQWPGNLPTCMQSQHGTLRFPVTGVHAGANQRMLDGSGAASRLQGLFMPMEQLREPGLQAANAHRPLHETITNTDGLAMATAKLTLDPSYAGLEFEKAAANIGCRFKGLWQSSDQFAKSYGVGKDVALEPEHLPGRLKDYMMVHVDTDVAFRYLNSPVTKKLYVAKVINFYLCKQILKYTEVVRGFDTAIDSDISKLKKQITHDITPVTKHSILNDISKCVVRATRKPGFPDFRLQFQRDHTNNLWSMLQPVLALKEGNVSNAVQQVLEEIVRDAHDLAVELYSMPYDSRYHFPEIDESYDPTVMENLDRDFDLALVNNAKVKMSITPVIRLGQNGIQPVRVRTICMGKVFTSLPGSKEDNPAGPSRTPGRGARR